MTDTIPNAMRTFTDAKAMAKSLRAALATRGVDLTHSDTLEIVAAQFNLDNWNVLAARINAAVAPDDIAFTAVTPILRIFDEARAKEFYVGFLGFTLDWEHRFGDNFPLYAQVSRAGMTLHLSGHHGDASPGSTVFVSMRGVQAYQKELAGSDYKHMKPGVETLPWGQVMEVIDPCSNRIRFCERPFCERPRELGEN